MTTVALYCRQSKTREEVSASNADQRAELEQLAARRGWAISRIYEDPNAPADDLDAREQWGELLLDADAGKFTIVAGYDTSRLWRSVEMKLATCRLLAAAGVTTVATLAGDTPTDATDNPEAGFISTVLAATAELDNQLRAKKVRAAHARAARAGKAWRGRRPYGWTAGRVEIVEDEANLIREAVDRVIRGEAISAIVRDWTERGITSAYGSRWQRASLTRMLRSPSLAGIRVHGDQRYPGTWPPIITEGDHVAVVAALDSRTRPRGGPGTPRLLTSSGLLRCGVCDAKMRATRSPAGKRQYACTPRPGTGNCGRVAILADLAEDDVRDQVLSVFDTDRLHRFVRAAADADARVQDAHATLTTLSERRALVGRTLVRVGDGDAARAALDELDQLETEARAVIGQASGAVGLLLEVAADPWRWWEDAEMLDRRRLLETMIVRIVVEPSAARAFRTDNDRVRIPVWRL